MFDYLYKKMRYAMLQQTRKESTEDDSKTQQNPEDSIASSLVENIRQLKQIMGDSSDIIFREFSFGQEHCMHAVLLFIDGLVDSSVINESIVEPLMYRARYVDSHEEMQSGGIAEVKTAMVAVGDVKEVTTLAKILEGVLSGDTVLLLDKNTSALVISTKGWDRRGVAEPSAESVIRGPREAFTENLRTNTALLRRKIKNPTLRMEMHTIGKKTRTPVCVSYIEGVANPELIDRINSRLSQIDTDAILESGYIEQYIEDAPFSLFATNGYSEKPDVVAAKMLEGRAAIIVDGTPFVLTAPFLLIEAFQSAEDYYMRPFFMSMLRLIRYVAFFITVMAPALYVAITTFHQELIPTQLLFTMAAAREGVPFPAIVEALIMLVAFEILREAGVRLPRPVGQAISIVGALIMGDAAVSAGLIGAPMVIVIAITTVSIFAVPTQADAAAILRIIYLLLSSVLGGFGLALGLLGTLVYLSSLKSYGFPYLSPIVPLEEDDLKDALVRFPLWMMHKRPQGMADKDPVRQQEPVPPPTDTAGSHRKR